MEWAVLTISGVILFVTVIANLFKTNVDTKSSFFLFATISGFVFGATVIKKWK